MLTHSSAHCNTWARARKVPWAGWGRRLNPRLAGIPPPASASVDADNAIAPSRLAGHSYPRRRGCYQPGQGTPFARRAARLRPAPAAAAGTATAATRTAGTATAATATTAAALTTTLATPTSAAALVALRPLALHWRCRRRRRLCLGHARRQLRADYLGDRSA